jgi:hypothetical protein
VAALPTHNFLSVIFTANSPCAKLDGADAAVTLFFVFSVVAIFNP